MADLAMIEDAKVVVGLDFGTTYSGFAYALRSEPEKIYTFYDWPLQARCGGMPYCKTQTSLWYMPSPTTPGSYELCDWGWPAFFNYNLHTASSPSGQLSRATQVSTSQLSNVFERISLQAARSSSANPADVSHVLSSGHFLTKFKLHLAGPNAGPLSAVDLPEGLTAQRTISDYLTKLSELILEELQNKFGPHIMKEDIQWCLTVPAIWDDHAKKQMKICAEIAGLVQGPRCRAKSRSPHPLQIVLEPEAASVYCQLNLSSNHQWSMGNKFMVVDAGGGTVDIVLHEKCGPASSLNVRELKQSTGGLCGGTYVDEAFFAFLERQISCFKRFAKENPSAKISLLQSWQTIKYAFDGEQAGFDLELPPRLASMLEDGDHGKSSLLQASIIRRSYDEIDLSNGVMKSIFDPVIKQILDLIDDSMVCDLNAIMVVGGFSESPYLMKRIRETFARRVTTIVSPPHPGSSVCCGAVTMGIRANVVMSRISRKTYGMSVADLFKYGTHRNDYKFTNDGVTYCRNLFSVFVKRGDEVPVNYTVTHSDLSPCSKHQSTVRIELYSTTSRDPVYVTDPGVVKEGSFSMSITSHAALGVRPLIAVSMYFGRSEVQIEAVGTNFGSGEKESMLPVKFDRDFV